MELNPGEVIEIPFPQVVDAKVVVRAEENLDERFILALIFANGARVHTTISDDFLRHAFANNQRDKVQLDVEATLLAPTPSGSNVR